MTCCRCQSTNTFALDTIHPNDNIIYRCRNCGLLFSPAHHPLPPQTAPTSIHRALTPAKSRLHRPAPVQE